jgi:hypothetical protein
MDTHQTVAAIIAIIPTVYPFSFLDGGTERDE